MKSLNSITEKQIEQACGEVIYDRSSQYVCSPELRKRLLLPKAEELHADISGNYGKYHVVFQPMKDGSIKTSCTCPAEMIFCKHAAALGITWLKEPETFFNIESISKILTKKSKKELQDLILEMIPKHPGCLSLLGIEGFDEENKEEEDWDDEDEWE